MSLHVHFDLASGQFDVTSMSLRLRVELRSMSVRCQFDVTLISTRSHHGPQGRDIYIGNHASCTSVTPAMPFSRRLCLGIFRLELSLEDCHSQTFAQGYWLRVARLATFPWAFSFRIIRFPGHKNCRSGISYKNFRTRTVTGKL